MPNRPSTISKNVHKAPVSSSTSDLFAPDDYHSVEIPFETFPEVENSETDESRPEDEGTSVYKGRECDVNIIASPSTLGQLSSAEFHSNTITSQINENDSFDSQKSNKGSIDEVDKSVDWSLFHHTELVFTNLDLKMRGIRLSVEKSESEFEEEIPKTEKCAEKTSPKCEIKEKPQKLDVQLIVKESIKRDAKKPEMWKRISRKFVAKPSKILKGETPQRPFIKELYWYKPEVSGTATEIFQLIFPKSLTSASDYCRLTDGNYSAPAEYLHELQEKRQETLRSYTGISENERERKKHLIILERLQNTLWLVHSMKIEDFMEETYKLMIHKCFCRFDEDQKLTMFSKDDLSLVWNTNIGIENSSILTQREAGWSIRPVFIDGLSLLDMNIPIASSLTMLPTKLLLEVIAHFILDGHKTVLYLPDFYLCNKENSVDDHTIFLFLCNMNLLKFVNGRNRKAVERTIIEDAEQCHGIIVSASESLSERISSAIQSFPVFNMYSSETNQFIFSSIFEVTNVLIKRFPKDFHVKSEQPVQEGVGSESQSDPETSTNSHNEDESDNSFHQSSSLPSDDTDSITNINCYQDVSKTCRLYTNAEKAILNHFNNQLTLARQTFLLSSFIHFTTFHCQRHRQIQTFLVLINRVVPELLPTFMAKSALDEISSAIQSIKDNNFYSWPIFSEIMQ